MSSLFQIVGAFQFSVVRVTCQQWRGSELFQWDSFRQKENYYNFIGTSVGSRIITHLEVRIWSCIEETEAYLFENVVIPLGFVFGRCAFVRMWSST